MDSPAPTPAPDPEKTAAAQATSNKETAVAQANLNNYDKIGPDGSLTYKVIGTNADGTPKYQQTTALSDSNQGIYDTNQATKQNIATIGKDQSARIGDLLGTPLKLGNEATEARINELGSKRLDPRFATEEAALRTRLANSGIQEGSQAWNDAYKNFSNSKNDAYNQLLLSGRQLADTEVQAERNSPINEITALMSGSQIGTPTFAATPQTSVAGTDVAGITQNSYLDANQQAQQAVAGNNATMGGLFGLAGTIGGAAVRASDRRLKKDVTRIGVAADGFTRYCFRYIAGGSFQIGVMADEVERVRPEAVLTRTDGFKMVDYSLLQGVA